jgi:hypothetical protein
MEASVVGRPGIVLADTAGLEQRTHGGDGIGKKSPLTCGADRERRLPVGSLGVGCR